MPLPIFFVIFTIICVLAFPTTLAAWLLNDWIHMGPFPRSAYSPLLFMTVSWICCLLAINRYLFTAAAIVVGALAWKLFPEPDMFNLVLFILLWGAASRDVYLWRQKIEKGLTERCSKPRPFGSSVTFPADAGNAPEASGDS